MEQDLLHQVPITLLLLQAVQEEVAETFTMISTIPDLEAVAEELLEMIIVGQRAQEQLE
jgi:ABC-type enterochelin transport system substrate-binding protein